MGGFPIRAVLGFLFVAISFVGGILTPITFTEMTAKAQDYVSLTRANQYLSWLSTFEIIGKFCYGIFSGSLVKFFGYYWTFSISSLIQLITALCYVLSRFDKPKQLNNSHS